MDKRKLILIAVSLVVLAISVFIFMKSGITTFNREEKVKAIPDPLDVTLDFYSDWLELQSGTTTNPYESELMTNGILTEAARNALKEAKSNGGEIDPFFCQKQTPARIGAKVLFELENKAEIIILDKTPSSTEPFSQAIVSLTKNDTAWNITNISCSTGEVAPVSEYDFDHEGYLIKSLPAPYKTGEWHLVFEQSGQMGYVAPLLFSTTSICSAAGGAEATCYPELFTEGTTAKVVGDMYEEGVSVVKLEIK